MTDDEPGERERLAAQLQLARDLQGLLVHELGNPLQSLSVLVELCHDDLQAADPEGKSTQRLTRALESLERLRLLLLRAGSARATLAGRGREPATWGQILDEFEGLLAERMARMRLGWTRHSEPIDAQAIAAGPLREALLVLLLGACDQARDDRLRAASVSIAGRIQAGVVGVCVGLRADGRAHPISDAIGARAQSIHPHCARESSDWLLWADTLERA